ncbi:sensor histidine kinase [Thauera linaloolentis]|uniref:histidine kinase n=1 Tax=Thauera linaloolentis (strain DSM 12138 / JCM 21573 / CCUG 41526 / CIP 105981 / IAM 15112 / NBRC 102519 / 47Lol) TaxID=1123367 RepID=N6YZ22_THAL4|nr:HAMP domain-containing sensor histidine kinase [Thauera linaloolentis]ENO87642.1 two component system sensor kinase [Thauera linaloolentis 47Lol = DSM 12138]MCM8565970.1 HAMP domain-containing histidine kinase [Thauera linaloolentis]
MSWAEADVPEQPASALDKLRTQAGQVAAGLLHAWPSFVRGDAPLRASDTAYAPPDSNPRRTAHMLLRTTHFRQASCFAYLFLLVTLGSIIWGAALLEDVLTSHVEDMVMAEIRAHPLLDGHGNAERLAFTLHEREAAVQRQERAAALQTADGRTVFGTAELLSPAMCPADVPPCTGWLRARLGSTDSVHEWLGLAYALPDGGRYVVAYDILPMLDRIYPVPLAAGVSVFLVLLVSLLAGLYFSLDKIRRIDRIRQAMGHFARGDMEARVPVRGDRDEFDHLASDINRELARISRLVEEVRNATNHIAHELRTPLARLQQRLSNASQTVGGDSTVCRELELAEEEAQRIQYLFRSVMRISEIETGRCQHQPRRFAATIVLAELQDYYGVLADERGLLLRTDCEKNCMVFGDRDLLFQALVNLVDNAIKYAPPDSTVTLLAHTKDGCSSFCVADEGPGIDAALRAQAVKRFQRLTRDRSIPGHGLGLALVQAVADLHGGSLTLGDNDLPGGGAERGRGLKTVLSIPHPGVAASIGMNSSQS